MGLFSKSKIKVQVTKSDSYSGWLKCSGCKELIHKNELEQYFLCCPKCGYHYRMSAKERLSSLLDEGSFEEKFSEIEGGDPLNFIDEKPYIDKLTSAKEASDNNEAVVVGLGKIDDRKVAIGVLDFSFLGGSMGCVVGERLTSIIELAIDEKCPVIIVSASGGARMQESILSLMQMAKTSGALAKLSEAALPYISVLSNPTSGGVTASFASLGDIIIAEPNALVAFAGPRVVEQTIKQKLPEGAQRSEFVLDHGFIDLIVERKNLRKKISYFIEFLSDNKKKNLSNENNWAVSLKRLIDESN